MGSVDLGQMKLIGFGEKGGSPECLVGQEVFAPGSDGRIVQLKVLDVVSNPLIIRLSSISEKRAVIIYMKGGLLEATLTLCSSFLEVFEPVATANASSSDGAGAFPDNLLLGDVVYAAGVVEDV